MQFLRRLLLISLVTILLNLADLNQSAKSIYLSQIAAFQHEEAIAKHSPLSARFDGLKPRLDPERYEDIRRVLSMIETGQTTMHLIDKYEIGVGFELGGGTSFFPDENHIIIDSRQGQFSAAINLVHEVTHAHLFHQGRAADLKRNNRHTFVQRKMEEEGYAIAASIQATSELRKIGVDISNLLPPVYYPYQQAYGSAFRMAKYNDRVQDEQTLQSIGQAAGLEVVFEAITEGRVVTSINQQTYAEYWGSVWDDNRDFLSDSEI